MKKFRLLPLVLSMIMTVSDNSYGSENKPPLIPLPAAIRWLDGLHVINRETGIVSDSERLADYFADTFLTLTGIDLKKNGSTHTGNCIRFVLTADQLNQDIEAYSMDISTEEIVISSGSETGLFRGIQTLLQMIPAEVKAKKNSELVKIPCVEITDKPEFSWRGLNLDCSRHFMTVDFIKRYIDILAYYKFNTLHWHITEDQGWRIEIKKYPKLTEIGAWRKEADGSIYGGFYSQDEIRDVVAYAESRFINVVPEIEMPGHSLASLAAYPENSCTGGPFEVTNVWGVHKDIYCAGRDSTFTFLQNILDEVIELFPGKYIHIGGDEAPKDRWKECPKCQQRIEDEGLKDEDELQSYFITRISKYLATKGKEIIGWDEILEGGLTPGAIVQSWRSYQGAIDAAESGHYTISSPNSHTYLDHDPDDLDLRLAYSFNPVPDELSEDEIPFVLGSEANMWTERAPQETIDSKLFPRLLALAEVFWHNPQSSKDKADYNGFYDRVQDAYADLSARGIEYGRETKVITPETSYNNVTNQFLVKIIRGQNDIEIRYTKDGSEPGLSSELYINPIYVSSSADLKIAAFKNGNVIGEAITLGFVFHKGLNSQITLLNNYDERYRAGGENALLDGIRGTADIHDNNWQGFEGVHFEGVIDLGKAMDITGVTPRFILNSNSWVFLPEQVEISLSNDNESYTDNQIILNDVPQKNSEIVLKDFRAEFNGKSARYVKVKATSILECPEWHPGAGYDAWLFIDEIVIE